MKFHHNYATRIRGPYYRGQMVQFDDCFIPGSRIMYNISDQPTPSYQSGTPEFGMEDHVNNWLSRGGLGDPIVIKYNKVRGGGPSESGGGILCGDGGGSNFIIESNILVNPGQYGISIAGGSNNLLLNNKVYSDSFPWSNVGCSSLNQSTAPFGNNEIRGNRINWTNMNGDSNPFWDKAGGTSDVLIIDNVFGDPTITAAIWDEVFPEEPV